MISTACGCLGPYDLALRYSANYVHQVSHLWFRQKQIRGKTAGVRLLTDPLVVSGAPVHSQGFNPQLCPVAGLVWEYYIE